jgi:hypothetical protein
MSKKHRGGPAPVPPGNRPQAGPPTGPGGGNDNEPVQGDLNGGAPFQEQDPERRLGGYATAGEHPLQQPGRANDGGTHSR